MQAIKGFPLLEELHLSMCRGVEHVAVFELIAKGVPTPKVLENL
jgi:hypothetical protein